MSKQRAWGRVFSPNNLPSELTVNDAIYAFLEAADDGSARDRRGRRFTTGAVDELRWSLLGHVAESLGEKRLADVRRGDVESLVDDLASSGLPPSRVHAVARSVRELYDFAIERGDVRTNPAERVALPEDGPGATQPIRRAPRPPKGLAYRATALALQLATLLFALLAVVLLVQSA